MQRPREAYVRSLVNAFVSEGQTISEGVAMVERQLSDAIAPALHIAAKLKADLRHSSEKMYVAEVVALALRQRLDGSDAPHRYESVRLICRVSDVSNIVGGSSGSAVGKNHHLLGVLETFAR